MLKKNKIEEIEITGMTAEGNGVGRCEGIAVFVPLTAIGDIARVRIVKVQKTFAYGILEELIAPSPQRIKFDCRVFSKCGGCAFRHIAYESECSIKENFVRDAFLRIGKIDTPVSPIMGSSSPRHYRNKAQYPVAAGNDGQAVCGFFSRRSHRVIPFTSCMLQPRDFEDIVNAVVEEISARGITPYQEETGEGLVRHIYLRKGWNTGETMVCLVLNAVNKQYWKEFFLPMAESLKERFTQIKSFVLNFNSKNTNVILGKDMLTVLGSDAITDVMCRKKIILSPLSFYQVNTPQAERLYGVAKDFAELSADDTLLDLYCGAGTVGLSMSDGIKKLIGVEIVPEAIENAKENAKANGAENAEFFCGDAGEIASSMAQKGEKPDVIVVDPPRKGCEIETLEAIVKMSPKRIVMISCNPATAARDCAILAGKGYAPTRIQPVDLFPRTTHVETCVLLDRCK